MKKIKVTESQLHNYIIREAKKLVKENMESDSYDDGSLHDNMYDNNEDSNAVENHISSNDKEFQKAYPGCVSMSDFINALKGY